MLQFQHVKKQFKKRVVLNDISLQLQNGVYGLLGPNGAGKTTMMRCVLGIYKLNAGQISFDGKDIKEGALNSEMGYLPQKFGLYKELKVCDMLTYFATLRQIPKAQLPQEINRVLSIVNLDDRANDRVGTLSGGMIRRLGIAQALLGDPKVLIFDEPTAGLDPEERMRFKNIVSALPKDKTIIISTHIVEDVEAVCDHIIVMNKGCVLASKKSGDIANMAAGKVYELQANTPLPPDAFVEKRAEKTGGAVTLRVLSKTFVPDGVLAQPTIEDGYMCMIKELVQPCEA